MFKILDMIFVRTIEKDNGIKFSKEQLDEARFNDGHISTRVSGRYLHFKIPIIFLHDLIQDHSLSLGQNGTSPWD